MKVNFSKAASSIQPCSTISHASSSTSVMSGTSQWAMSDPIMALSSAPNGLTDVLKAIEVSGSSASQPK